ncbi:translin-like [Corticium candelabrum]|uniref:translin-like n=1 Tax=Corticium candelabrum TaxID=121492 RepID=UPI002E256D69|nr:translin-like [Corticium candelabrum]
MSTVSGGPSSQLFADFQQYVTREQNVREEIRKTVRELDNTSREILNMLQTVHQTTGVDMKNLCVKSREKFVTIQKHYAELQSKVPPTQYYRYHDHWRTVTQNVAFSAAFLVYLESEKLIAREELATLLGVCVGAAEGFHIDLEDFLMGLLNLASELARLAVNSVTAADYGRPFRISGFLAELSDGFRLLNLKNDALRRRFDGLKYDVKKVEEVVYDITIRGLKPS